MERAHEITPFIKAEALRLGFNRCGVAAAGPVDEATGSYLRSWLDAGHAGTMAYLAHHFEKRCNPALLVEGTQSIVSVALGYYPAKRLSPVQYQFAYYAYGRDYHEVVKEKLNVILQELKDRWQVNGRAFCDAVPLLERYWAARAGVGWIGKNRQMIVPGAGSYFLLGELLLDVKLDYDTPIQNLCGDCTRCLQACPTKALTPQGMEASHCLSYLTIEHKGEIPPQAIRVMGHSVYGCDRCQQACPYNQDAQPTREPSFAPSAAFLSMQPRDWQGLTPVQFNDLFHESAVMRCRYDGLMRNIRAVDHEP